MGKQEARNACSIQTTKHEQGLTITIYWGLVGIYILGIALFLSSRFRFSNSNFNVGFVILVMLLPVLLAGISLSFPQRRKKIFTLLLITPGMLFSLLNGAVYFGSLDETCFTEVIQQSSIGHYDVKTYYHDCPEAHYGKIIVQQERPVLGNILVIKELYSVEIDSLTTDFFTQKSHTLIIQQEGESDIEIKVLTPNKVIISKENVPIKQIPLHDFVYF
jgi:hypothetical protein